MTMNAPITIIIRDPKEQTKKCSIYPLKGKREDLLFYTWPVSRELPLAGYVRLAPTGPPLSREDSQSGLLILDASWRRSRAMMRDYESVPPRSLEGYQTAFPRISNLGTDPDNGLATVEALFIAYHILGRETEGILDHYRWREEFLRLNDFQ